MLCTTETYSQFSLKLHQKGIHQNLPINGGIDVTSKCNFRCIHCYINESHSQCSKPHNDQELSFSEYCLIVDQISEAGCLWLQITGGEPLLRPDFTNIYLYAKEKGLLPILFTNGSLITEKIAALLRDYPPFVVEITLYGASADTYKAVTGNGNNFNRVIKGIELLKKYGIQPKLKSIVINQNVTELPAMKLLAEKLGSKLTIDTAISQNLNNNLPLEKIRLSPSEVVDLDLKTEERRSEWVRLYKDHSIPESRRSSLFWCSAGRGNFHIDSTAKMFCCVMCRTPSFDLRQGTFLDGWINLVSKTQDQGRTKESECTQCQDQILCHQCPGHAILEKNDREKTLEYFCEIAKLRKRKLIN